MDLRQPIYTGETQCQDCYKCLRQCTCKAIEIREGHAQIIPELCIVCGHCVSVCPTGAKQVRDDLERAKLLLQVKEKVIVSLAPSFVSEFKGIEPEKIIHSLKLLGFYGVSETALGAQEVSANVAAMIDRGDRRLYISSACPSVVALIRKYYPQYDTAITDLLSPVAAHCKMLHRRYGADIGTVFIGPCASKKVESDNHPDLLNVALTFMELSRWWKEEGIDPAAVTPESDIEFIPQPAKEGALYPVDGGMLAGVRANCSVSDMTFMAFSGTKNIMSALEELDMMEDGSPLFLELLACEGGCVNGPLSETRQGTARKRRQVMQYTDYPENEIPRSPSIDIRHKWEMDPVHWEEATEEEIRQVLESVGMFRQQDELNCSGCGYDNCREFALAVLAGRAETIMCVGYMRKQAQKKADALVRTMPSGVLIVNEDLKVVQSNRRFAEIMGADLMSIYQAHPGLAGAKLEKLVKFSNLFSRVLASGTELIEKQIRTNGLVLGVTIFTIEPHKLVGCILQDVTVPSVRKEQIIKKADEMIAKNVATVQKIAYLLGESSAEAELILNSIIDAFTPEIAAGESDDER